MASCHTDGSWGTEGRDLVWKLSLSRCEAKALKYVTRSRCRRVLGFSMLAEISLS